jgi:hypothetical protein
MFATALPRLDWTRLRLSRSECLRAIAVGAAWGVTLTAGLAAMTFWKCGLICLPEIAENAVLSVIGGILTVGAVAAYGRR